MAPSNDPCDESFDSTVDSPYTTKELRKLVQVSESAAACTHPDNLPQNLQLENAGFRNELRVLSSGANTTSNASTGATSDASASTGPAPVSDHKKPKDPFDSLGRSFCILYEIWPREGHLTRPFPEDLRELGPWHPQRYSNKQTKREAIIAEIYHFVPREFHEFVERLPTFASKVCLIIALVESLNVYITQFLGGADAQRSYLISTVRTAAPNIFPVATTPGLFSRGNDRSTDPAIMSLLQNPGKPDDTYPRYPRVLYKDSVVSGRNVFGGSAIVNVSRMFPCISSPVTSEHPSRY